MFFSYIIQFLIVLFVYLSLPAPGPPPGLMPEGGMILLGLLLYGGLCRAVMSRVSSQGALNRAENRLGWLAVFLFTANVYLLDLPGLMKLVPGAGKLTFVDGLCGLGFYYLYMLLLWWAGLIGRRRTDDPELSAKSHFQTQLRLTLPLLLPWFLMALAYDLIENLGPDWLDRWIGTGVGELVLIVVILAGLTVLVPPLVTRAWGCRPLEPGPAREVAESFLAQQGVRVRQILNWPLFGGRLITAGVMGLLPSLRYLMVTPGLIQTVDQEEFRAVLAHEAGHLKHRHLLLYLLFFLGYIILAYALGGVSLTWLLGLDPVAGLLLEDSGRSGVWFSILISAPMLILLVVYFRFIFAYFMRHFERQADAFAALKVGPGPVREALWKIALRSGINPRAPSWHHFSIAQRIEFLDRLEADPGLYQRHGRGLKKALLVYLAGMIAILGAAAPLGLFQGPEKINLELALKGLERAVQAAPVDPRPRLYQAMILTRLERFAEAVPAYEQTLALAPEEPTALNDLAWLLATGPRELRDPPRALDLARRAAGLKPEPAVLDTLAEACFVNGLPGEAVRWSREALALEPEDRAYFEAQVKRFEKARQEKDGG